MGRNSGLFAEFYLNLQAKTCETGCLFGIKQHKIV